MMYETVFFRVLFYRGDNFEKEILIFLYCNLYDNVYYNRF